MTTKFGWLDTNLFVHPLFANDPHRPRCHAILQGLQDGDAEGWLDPTVVHELTFVLGRQRQFADRRDVHQYVQGIVLAPGVHAEDKPGLLEALDHWERQNVGFVDAWLGVLARRRGMPICSVNRADFPGLPNTFPPT